MCISQRVSIDCSINPPELYWEGPTFGESVIVSKPAPSVLSCFLTLNVVRGVNTFYGFLQ